MRSEDVLSRHGVGKGLNWIDLRKKIGVDLTHSRNQAALMVSDDRYVNITSTNIEIRNLKDDLIVTFTHGVSSLDLKKAMVSRNGRWLAFLHSYTNVYVYDLSNQIQVANYTRYYTGSSYETIDLCYIDRENNLYLTNSYTASKPGRSYNQVIILKPDEVTGSISQVFSRGFSVSNTIDGYFGTSASIKQINENTETREVYIFIGTRSITTGANLRTLFKVSLADFSFQSINTDTVFNGGVNSGFFQDSYSCFVYSNTIYVYDVYNDSLVSSFTSPSTGFHPRSTGEDGSFEGVSNEGFVNLLDTGEVNRLLPARDLGIHLASHPFHKIVAYASFDKNISLFKVSKIKL